MNTSNQPKISIVTIVKNRVEFIRDAIENVMSQNYENFEHIVIDGASEDGTLEVIQSYPHLIWISEPDAGSVYALNKGLKLVKGEIFGWLNSDELYEPNLFHEISKQFVFDSSVEVIYGTTEFISANKEHLGHTRFKRFNLQKEILGIIAIAAPSSVFVRSSALDKVGRQADERWKDTYDHDLWIRLGKVAKFKGVNKIFSKFTLHGDSGVASNPNRAIQEAKLVRTTHGGDGTILGKFILAPIVDLRGFIYKHLVLKRMSKRSR